MGSSLYKYLSASFHKFTVELYTAFSYFQATAFSIAVLVFVLIGWNCWKGNFKESTQKFIYVMFSLPFTAWAIFYDNGWFITSVLIPTFVDFPFDLAIWIIKVASGSNNGLQGIDLAFGALFNAIDHLGRAAEGLGLWHNVKVYAAVFALSTVYGFLYLAFYATQILSMGTLYIFLGISPPFIYLLSFPQTRGWGITWLRECIKYALMAPLAGTVMGVTLSASTGSLHQLEKQVLADPDNLDVFGNSFGAALLISFLTLYMLKKVPEWAAALTQSMQSDQGAFAGGHIKNMGKNIETSARETKQGVKYLKEMANKARG